MITMLTMITVATKNLIAGRISVVFQPFVKLVSVVKKATLPAKLTTIIIDVVESQKERFSFTAASANVTTVSDNSLMLKPVVVIKRYDLPAFCMILVPLSSPNSVLCRILLSVFDNPFTGTDIPFRTVFVKAFFALFSVPFQLVFLLLATRTSFNHDISSVIKTIFDYEYKVKGKVQRSFRKEVGASVPKRIAPRTGDDMICSVWEHAAAL